MSTTIKTHYLSGTHWDREWYRPLAEFRFLLVRLMDNLLDLMEENEAFRYFHLDGQTCILDDYMALRPDQRPRLEKLMQEGRILAGPWYTMPDLFCVGQEALVRNLLMGARLCREWDIEPMPIAFTCDMFGHPSQMPQIYAGFGLNDCVLGRGTNEHTHPPLFWWEAPDGSKVFCFKVQDKQGYGAFAVPRSALEGPNFMSEQEADIGAALKKHRIDPDLPAIREKLFKQKLHNYIDHENQRFDEKILCLMDWMDHSVPATEVAQYLRLIKEIDPRLDAEHSTLPAFFSDARDAGGAEAPTYKGELYDPSKNLNPYLLLIPNCVSSRVRMKQANDHCQQLLEQWAEPWTLIANAHGADLHDSFLQHAWKTLLLNHAHDSICGCSIDQVHRDMMTRFDESRLTAEQLRYQSLGALTRSARDLARTDDEFTLTIATSTPHRETRVAIVDIDLPLDYPTQFVEGFSQHPVKSFTLETEDGTRVSYQRLSRIPKTNERSRFADYCFTSEGEFTRYRVAMELERPGIGYTSLRVIPSKQPVRIAGTLRTGPTAAANEHIAIACDPNGTLTLTDKTTGETYTGLLTLSDRSEIGDGWFHDHAVNDQQILSTGSKAQVSVEDDGPLRVTFRIEQTLDLPASYDKHTEAPSSNRVEFRVIHRVHLDRGARGISVDTDIENNALDHRLQLLLPSDAVEAKTWLAHHPYDFVERDIAIREETTDWQEMEQVEKAFLDIQAVGCGSRGLAFLSGGGLHEGGVRDDHRRTIQVTLVRAFRQTIQTTGEVDGQEQGIIQLRWGLIPYAGSLPRAEALKELAVLQSGLITRQSGARPSGHPVMDGDKDPEQSFVEQLDGDLMLSTLKAAEDGSGDVILRAWNPTDVEQQARFRLWGSIKKATAVQLSEKPDSDAKAPTVQKDELTLVAGAKKAVTVRLTVTQ